MRYILYLFLFLFSYSTPGFSGTYNPLKYYLSFDNMDFISQDWVEQSKFKTVEERKLEITEGRFGKALYLGAIPLDYDDDNMSGLDLDLITAVIFNVGVVKMKGRGYDEPFIWGAGKLNPGYGAVSFWVKGSSVPANKNQRNILFEQTTSGWGRKERQLMEMELMPDGSITAYVEDARYYQHSIKTKKVWNDKGWNFVVFNWDKSSGLSLWVNGKEVSSTMGTDAWWENQLPGIFHLPMSRATYDEFRIFGRPLAADEIISFFKTNGFPKKLAKNADSFSKPNIDTYRKSFIQDDSKLVTVTPSKNGTKAFCQIMPERIQDDGIQGWWICDGRYELASPHEYSVFTVIPGDVDYHAEKADILPPAGAHVNYITFEGNLDGITVLKGNRAGNFDREPSLAVPKTTAFFYGAFCEGLGNSELRIPYTKSYGSPPGFNSDGDVLNLPLSGDLRLHEVGIFNVSDKPLKNEAGDIVLGVSPKTPILDGKRYPVALNAIFADNDRQTAGIFNTLSPGAASTIEIPAMRRCHFLSDAFSGKTCVNRLSLNLWVKSPADGNVIQFRFRDPAVPSHTWTHAEVKLNGFSAEYSRLAVSLEFEPVFLAGGDRIWIEIVSTGGLSILTGDAEKYSSVIVGTDTEWVSAEPKYSFKTMLPNILTYGRSFEYIPWQWDKMLPDVDAPETFGGMFDMAYPWQAVLKNVPGDRLGNIYKAFGKIEFIQGHYPVEKMTVPARKFDAPANAPLWAVYFREIQTFREKIVTWWSNHQRSDGQVGGGWNDDTLIFSRSTGDFCLDGESVALTLYNKVFDGFEKTNYFKDGYCRIYPIDRLHNGDFVRERYKSLIFNTGDPRSAVWAMQEAWHWGKPDKTPINYSNGRGFLFGKDVMEWYWGKRKAEKPYTIVNREELIETLRKAAITNNDTCLWRYTDAWIHTDDQTPNGADKMTDMIAGGFVSDEKRPDDSNVTISVGVSWPEGGGPQLARFVEYSSDSELKISMYSFDDFPRPVKARLFRLDPGSYKLSLWSDKDSNGSYETIIEEKEIRIDRFDLIPFTVPSKVPFYLTLKQIKADPPAGDLPDLASSDFYISKNDRDITAVIFNIGSADSGPFKVTVSCGAGNDLQTIEVPSIKGSYDFVPGKREVVFKNLPVKREYRFRIDSDNTVKEIYEGNNTAVFKTGDL